MGRCFVIQPFDGGAFDKRYDDVFLPAIKDSGLEPYRVDKDPGVTIPIEEIERGIRNANLCLAEITTNNPNVWFELGFAIAVPKEVVLICSDKRGEKFPFDVQHRNIITYKTEAPRDFEELRQKITDRIKAILQKEGEITRVSKLSPLKETEGLQQHEMVALVTVMQNSFVGGNNVSGWRIQEDMNNAGFTNIAISLALKVLSQKGMVTTETQGDETGDIFSTYTITSHGENWLLQNQEKLLLKKKPDDKKPDDDLPF